MSRFSSSGSVRLLCCGALLLAVACSGGLSGIRPIPVTSNPSEQVAGLADRVEEARQARVALLAPTWFGRAETSLGKARALLRGGGSVQAILDAVARGRAELEEAERFSRISETTFPEVLKAREDARAAGAPEIEGYGDVEEGFLELTSAVEGDDLGWAQRNASRVEKSYRTIELAAIKERTGNRIRELIRLARQEGAAKLAPKTLRETEKRYQQLDDFITGNRYASEEIGARAAEALFQANRLLSLTRQAARLRDRDTETLALVQEGQISGVADSLAVPDLRDQDFERRYETLRSAAREMRRDRDHLVGNVDTLRREIEDLATRIADLEGQSSAERARLGRLEEERRFQELYTEVSTYFEPDEAEVYKQGQQLVIRLRSIQFPVGSAILGPESYAILSKVQRAIRAFGDPKVVIEGHTDSTGSAAVNDHLSQRRADSVGAYLVANNTLPTDHLSAVGRGFSDPLASNKTQEGRASNRRIDVLITATRRSPGAVSAP